MKAIEIPGNLIALQDIAIARWSPIPQGPGRYGNNNLKRAKVRNFFFFSLEIICPDASRLETAQAWAQVIDMAELNNLTEDN